MAHMKSFELADRSYLREKVVGVYEQLWLQRVELDDRGWTELFYLKVNAVWLQEHIASLPAAELRRATPVVRALFSQCVARLGPEHESSTRGHALETASGVLLGLGGRTFHSFGADALELLCGIEEADSLFDELMGKLRPILAAPPANPARAGSAGVAVALRRSALRFLLALACATDNLSSNLLLESVLHRLSAEWAPPTGTGAAPAAGSFALAASLELGGPGEMEDACRVLVMLGHYRLHENRNDCLALLSTPAASGLLRPVVSRSLRRIMYPFLAASLPGAAGEGGGAGEVGGGGGGGPAADVDAAGGGDGGGWGNALLRTLEWTARSLSLEAYLPSAVALGLAGPQTTATHLSTVAVALLVCLEWGSTFGGAPFAAACEATPPPAGAPRAALARDVLGAVSLLGCECNEGLHELTLRLGLLVLDSLLEGEPTRQLLLTTDAAPSPAGMPLWHLYHSRPTEKSIPAGTTLLTAVLETAATAVAAAAAAAAAAASGSAPGSSPPALGPASRVAADAARTCHRAADHALAAGLSLSSVDWPQLYRSLLSLARTLGHSDHRAHAAPAASAAPPFIALLNLVVGRGAELGIPEGGMQELAAGVAAAQPAVARLLRVAREGTPPHAAWGVNAASPIARALDALSPADAVPTPAEALLLLRKAAAGPDALAAASRPPPPLSPHSRDAFVQTLMRSLIAHARSDGSVAPLHIEEAIGANAASY